MFKISDEDIMSFVQQSFREEAKERGLLLEEDEKEKVKQLDIKLFKLFINERLWGRSREASLEGRLLNQVASNIKGETALEKILDLNNIVDNQMNAPAQNCSFDQLFSRITLLNTISSLIHEFEPGAGGQILEGFLAGLLGGQQVKSIAGQQEDLVDLEAGGKLYSIKLMTPVTEHKVGVKGSYDLLYQKLFVEGKEVEYIIFLKEEENKILVKKFIITKDNILSFFSTMYQSKVSRYFLARSRMDEGQEQAGVAKANEEALKVAGLGKKFYLRKSFFQSAESYDEGILSIDTVAMLQAAEKNLIELATEASNLVASVNSMIEGVNAFLLASSPPSEAQAKVQDVSNNINIFAQKQLTSCG
jgi:hypothetical protein